MLELSYLYEYKLKEEEKRFKAKLLKYKKETRKRLDEVNFKVSEITGIQKVMNTAFLKELNKESKLGLLFKKLDIVDIEKLLEEQQLLQEKYAYLYNDLGYGYNDLRRNDNLRDYHSVIDDYESNSRLYKRLINVLRQEYKKISLRSIQSSDFYKHNYEVLIGLKPQLDDYNRTSFGVEIVCENVVDNRILYVNVEARESIDTDTNKGKVFIYSNENCFTPSLYLISIRKPKTFEEFKLLNKDLTLDEMDANKKDIHKFLEKVNSLSDSASRYNADETKSLKEKIRYLEVRNYVLSRSLEEVDILSEETYLKSLDSIVNDLEKMKYVMNKRLPKES